MGDVSKGLISCLKGQKLKIISPELRELSYRDLLSYIVVY